MNYEEAWNKLRMQLWQKHQTTRFFEENKTVNEVLDAMRTLEQEAKEAEARAKGADVATPKLRKISGIRAAKAQEHNQ